MKKFQYRLQKVLEYRKMQADVEEGKLAARRRELELLRGRRAEMEEAWLAVRGGVHADPMERAALSSYRQDYEVRRRKLEQDMHQKAQEVDAQLGVYVRAKQKSEVLEKVKLKQHDDWEKAFQKELDELAMDSFLSRWKPPERGRVS